MLRISLVILALSVFLYSMISTHQERKEYWENVGPNTDKILNPNKYTDEG
jgi:hypothetical protein